MRGAWIAAGMLAVSCLVAGCDGGTSTVTPDEAKAGLDFVKRWPETKATKAVAAPTSELHGKN